MLDPRESARERNVKGFIGAGALPALSRNSLGAVGAAARTLDEFELLRDIRGRIVMGDPGDRLVVFARILRWGGLDELMASICVELRALKRPY